MAGLGAALGAVWAPAWAGELKKPNDVGRKFQTDGRPMPFLGNTVLCHLPQQGENTAYFNALLNIFRDAPAHSFFKKFAMLPPSSYHVTIFDGANDQGRVSGKWPKGLDLAAPIEDCHQFLSDRLKTVQIRCALPLRFRIDNTQSQPSGMPFTIGLLPFDHAENVKLRALRDQLSELMGIRAPGHDAYRFHTTICYPFDSLSAEEETALQDYKQRLRDQLIQMIPEIHLGPPEYCTYTDMFAFRREFYLNI